MKYEWTIKTIPAHNNPISSCVRKMNKWGNLPAPFSRPVKYYKRKLFSYLTNCKNIECDYDMFLLYGNISGRNLFLSNAYMLDYAPIIFGDGVTLGKDVKIITSEHELGNFDKVVAKEIIIGDNVWLTMNIVVLPGVHIGNNSVIGAGSVVTKDIPDNVLAAGNPAKVIKGINR